MNLFWLFCELPAPEMFLNATSPKIGDWVFIQCICPLNFLVPKFFFCKDGNIIASCKAEFNRAVYKFNISEQSSGQYCCGYQHKDSQNQEKKSMLSGKWELVVLPGQTIPRYIWVLRTAIVVLLLFSAPIFQYFFRK